jgi:hypothetical protein
MRKELPLTLADNLRNSLEAPEIDPVHLSIANDYLSGMDVQSLSQEYGVTGDLITGVLEKGEVKSYIDNTFLTQGYLHRNSRLQLINRVIEEKLEAAVDENGDGELSSKDLLDWMKLLHEMDKEARPKKTGPAVAIQINNYEKLMNDLIKE